MIGVLREWIRTIVVVVLCLSFVEMILPETRLQKFTKVFIGLAVLAMIISPFLKMAVGPSLPGQGFSLNEGKGAGFLDVESVMAKGSRVAGIGLKTIGGALKTKVTEQVESLVELMDGVSSAKAEVFLDSLGKIDRMQVVMYSNLNKDDMELRARKLISRFYGLPKENVFVVIKPQGRE